ncbi:MAG: DsbA family protein [bacterium]
MENTAWNTKLVSRLSIASLLVAVAVLAAGYFAGCRNSSADSGGERVKVVLEDGTPLADRLDKLESDIAELKSGSTGAAAGGCENLDKSLSDSNQNLVKEVQKLLKNHSLININPTYPPLQLFDLSKLPSKGSKDALVTIIEFSDFQCPACRRMALYLDNLVNKNQGQVRLVFVDRILRAEYRDGYPFHPYALIAHEAAAEAQVQGKFWDMYIHIFKNQKALFPARPKSEEDYEKKKKQVREKLIQAAGELDMDKEAMREALSNHTHREALLDTNEMAKKMDINSTPTVWSSAFFRTKNPQQVVDMINRATELK